LINLLLLGLFLSHDFAF